MNRVNKLNNPPSFLSYSAVGGYLEGEGPLGRLFDITDGDDTFGKDTFEEAEGEMGRLAVNTALSKIGFSHKNIDLCVAGDLQNQCVASSMGLASFGIPFLGVYGACSTCTESLLIAAAMLECGAAKNILTLTTSHNSAAERQFRTPLEYGALRSPSAQWTATAAGAFILSTDGTIIDSHKKNGVVIKSFMAGRMIDGSTADASNMGGAMCFAAADSVEAFFKETELSEIDLIVTGDLGRVGSDILESILSERIPTASHRHTDCGLLLYDIKSNDVHSGASGCGTSASVLSSYFLPLIERGEVGDILFLSTGALMSPSSVLQGNNIFGIAPAIHIGRKNKNA